MSLSGLQTRCAGLSASAELFVNTLYRYFLNYRVSSFYYCMWMTHRPNAITHTQEYTVLPEVVRHTFIIFCLFTTPNLCPPTQNPGDATANQNSQAMLQSHHHYQDINTQSSVLWHIGWATARASGRKKLGAGLLVVMIWPELYMSYSSSCHHHLHQTQ